MEPVINWNKCDGCGKCVANCPTQALGLRNLNQDDYDKLNFWGKVKWKRKGRLRAYVIDKSSCVGCRICQKHCHERALKTIYHK